MAKKLGIIAYGTSQDRLRLESLAKISNTSASGWLIAKIREEFKASFGDVVLKEKMDAE